MSILNTSVSGMSADQNWLSSISQNVANSTTTGYKDVETDFSTMVDQAAGGPYDGAGVQTTTISYNSLQGSVVSSTTATNLAVQGSGFFVVSDSAGNLYLTRNGSFVPDSSGNLVNSSGYYLMADNIQNGQPVSSNSLGSLQKVNVESSGLTAATNDLGFACGQSAFDGDGDPRSRPADHQHCDIDLHRRDFACRLRQPRRRPHRQPLFRQHWHRYLGGRRLSTPRRHRGWLSSQTHGPLGTWNLTFSSTRHDSPHVVPTPATFTAPGGQTISLDLSNTTQLATGFTVTSATANGSAPASLSGVSIATDGTLSYTLLEWGVDQRLRHSARQCGEPGQPQLRQRRRLHDDRGVGSDFPRNRRVDLGHDRVEFARKLDGRPRHRAHRHDSGPERLRGQLQGVSDGGDPPRRPEQFEIVIEKHGPSP